MKPKLSVGFIGTGNMGQAIIGGLVANNYPANLIVGFDHNLTKLNLLAEQYKINIADNLTQIAKCNIIVLAVKPNAVVNTCHELIKILPKDHQLKLIISIAAGIKISKIKEALGNLSVPIVRVMPNTPALINQGISALYAADLDANLKNQTQNLLNSVGQTIWVNSEDELDIVTALSGSGPAYFFLIFEALIKAAVKLGLQEDIAQQLAIQTAIGASLMAKDQLAHNIKLSTLRENVTSKGGTTEQGLNALREGNLEQIIENAIKAAAKQSKVLSEN